MLQVNTNESDSVRVCLNDVDPITVETSSSEDELNQELVEPQQRLARSVKVLDYAPYTPPVSGEKNELATQAHNGQSNNEVDYEVTLSISDVPVPYNSVPVANTMHSVSIFPEPEPEAFNPVPTVEVGIGSAQSNRTSENGRKQQNSFHQALDNNKNAKASAPHQQHSNSNPG